MNYEKEFNRWRQTWKTVQPTDLTCIEEFDALANNDELCDDAFYTDLTFGTGGLRGKLGVGPNRLNVITVAYATRAVADYCLNTFGADGKADNKIFVAISYDSRHKSRLFAEVVAGILAGKGIKAYLYETCMPTPCLSYAVRKLNCAVGIMITASHNPREYNGYKVYGSDGCQITPHAANEILSYMKASDYFDQSPFLAFDEGLKQGIIQYIPQSVIDDFENEVLSMSQLYGDTADKSIRIVYSPLHGTGAIPVTSVLDKAGFKNITTVAEQMVHDGDFPTCPKPNPEEPSALDLALKEASKAEADVVMATDPDCDRLGIAVRDNAGNYVRLTGNEVGILLLEYICSQRKKHNAFPKNPLIIRTVVTTDWADVIAERYGVDVVTVLTGFKYIGEQIGLLEDNSRADDYIFGFEESCGYLSGSYVRDKDGVNAAFLVAEMAAFYKAQGISLYNQLQTLYKRDGIRLQSLYSYTFEGATGKEQMQSIMTRFRSGAIKKLSLDKCVDYAQSVNGLPATDMLHCIVDEQSSFVLRPSGTEPKLKSYIFVKANSHDEANSIEQNIANALAEEVNL